MPYENVLEAKQRGERITQPRELFLLSSREARGIGQGGSLQVLQLTHRGPEWPANPGLYLAGKGDCVVHVWGWGREKSKGGSEVV